MVDSGKIDQGNSLPTDSVRCQFSKSLIDL